jgi:mannose-6-phosphate isomerase-like protein (cupin superfamily)
MKRKRFLLAGCAAVSAFSAQSQGLVNTNALPFKVGAGKSRFGEIVKFLGVHPNDLKISSKDTNNQLSVFEYIGLGKAGPAMHIHFEQDEIFFVIEGDYHFVVGGQSYYLTPGDSIFLPRNVPHTWRQNTERGRLLYFLQPAGKMEEFFSYMNTLTSRPSDEELEKIHRKHGMSVVGPPLES